MSEELLTREDARVEEEEEVQRDDLIPQPELSEALRRAAKRLDEEAGNNAFFTKQHYQAAVALTEAGYRQTKAAVKAPAEHWQMLRIPLRLQEALSDDYEGMCDGQPLHRCSYPMQNKNTGRGGCSPHCCGFGTFDTLLRAPPGSATRAGR